MKGSKLIAIAGAFLIALSPITLCSAQSEVQRPRLVVVISVDQLARWVLDEVYPFLPEGGIRRLVESGTDFTNCAYLHACTETGPGHATIGTGAPAAIHGIIANEWWDQDGSRRRYCVSDEAGRPVGYQGSRGIGPGLLLVPTLGEALKAQRGSACKVISLSWKDRAAVLMAGRGADLAAWMNFAKGDFVSSTSYVPELPAWLTSFNRERHVDGYFAKTWDREDNDAAFADLIDDRKFEGVDYDRRRTLPERIDGGLEEPGPRFYDHLYRSPYSNRVLLELAEVAVREERLGRDEYPDLLYLGFSANDVVGHRFGPRSYEARDISLKFDRQLAELLSFLDESVGVERYAVVLSADHGVDEIPEALQSAGVDAGRSPRLLRKLRKVADKSLRKAYGPPPEGTPRWVWGVSGRGLHLNLGALATRKIPVEDAEACVAEALSELSELVRVAIADELSEDETDPLLRALYFGRQPQRSGELLYVQRAHWLAGTTPASHGSPYPYDREVPMLAAGPGIRAGWREQSAVSPGLIAVLVARLLGIDPPAAAEETVPEGVLSR